MSQETSKTKVAVRVQLKNDGPEWLSVATKWRSVVWL